jgi:hypothetical protein
VDGLLGSRPTDAARAIADTGTAWNGLDRTPPPTQPPAAPAAPVSGAARFTG